MRHHHSPGIRGQLMWFLCCICLFLLALVWFLSTQLLEPLYTKHIEKQLTTQAESITAELDKAIANGEALSAWSFGHLTVNTTFFDRLATQLYASGSLNSFCVDISDTTMRTIYKIENQSYCNLHETLLSDSANNDMIVSTAVAMRKKCRTTGGFVQTLNPPRLSGSAQLLVGRNTSGQHLRRRVHRSGHYQPCACGRSRQGAEHRAAHGSGADLCLCHDGGMAVQ